jgi:hypothetical protein
MADDVAGGIPRLAAAVELRLLHPATFARHNPVLTLYAELVRVARSATASSMPAACHVCISGMAGPAHEAGGFCHAIRHKRQT